MNSMLKKMLKFPVIGTLIIRARVLQNQYNLYRSTKKALSQASQNKDYIYYLGIPAHNNLGDLAQGICIREWIRKHYSEYSVIEIETNALVNTRFSLLKELKQVYKSNDLIIFQSGYTTTDLGGYADEMHRAVIQALPDAKLLMMPQTIFFRHESNRRRTSKIYSMAKNMLFLARDEVSYKMACEMLPDLSVKLFPDIVTTLIGKYSFNGERDGILFCCRDDEEKYYSDEEIAELKNMCKWMGAVNSTDTTKQGKRPFIVKHATEYVMGEIEKYSRYKLIITDRYHGTILSLVAGTPVIIIKTNDHKVVTGAQWFQGIYDEYVYLAEDLKTAYKLATQIYYKNMDYKLEPYFEKHYYDELPKILKEMWWD